MKNRILGIVLIAATLTLAFGSLALACGGACNPAHCSGRCSSASQSHAVKKAEAPAVKTSVSKLSAVSLEVIPASALPSSSSNFIFAVAANATCGMHCQGASAENCPSHCTPEAREKCHTNGAQCHPEACASKCAVPKKAKGSI